MPNIILDSVRGLQPVPIDDVFLKDRKIFLVGEVNDASCNDLIKQLLYMEAEDIKVLKDGSFLLPRDPVWISALPSGPLPLIHFTA